MKDRMRRIHTIHFVGIGGSGMSGIAEGLLNLGYRVQGPDLKPHAGWPRSHRLAGEPSLSLSMLADEPMVLLDVPPSGGYFRSIFSEVGLTPNVAYSSPSLEMVRSLVGQGLGYSVLATRPAADITYDGNAIVTIPISDNVSTSTLVVAWSRQNQLTKQARALAEFCRLAIGAADADAQPR